MVRIVDRRAGFSAAVCAVLLVVAGCTGSGASERSSTTAAPAADTPVPAATATGPADAAPTPASPPPASDPASGPTVAPSAPPAPDPTVLPTPAPVAAVATRTGAGSLLDDDLNLLHGSRVGLIAHRASVVDGRSLAAWIDDHPKIELAALFAPEHGLYGTADAGAQVGDLVDPETQVPVYSLYGEQRAPTPDSLAGIDILVYDLQDVGARFYTYTSTLGLAMQAAADANILFVVLDRPNPLGGNSLQGPTLTTGLESFIGLYPIPTAYGLTVGELANLIKRRSMLPGLQNLQMIVTPMRHWDRSMTWVDTGLDWIPPSPNLPTPESALVYPGTVLFEATSISEGRGTDEPFTLIGAQWIDEIALADDLNARALPGVSFEAARFVPRSIPGAAESPRFMGQELAGVRVHVTDPAAIRGVEVGLTMLDAILRQGEEAGLSPATLIERPQVFDRLAGTSAVRRDLIAGVPVGDILASFKPDQSRFAELKADFELYD